MSYRNNHGIALPLAIFALVIIGALVAGAFFVGLQDETVGRNTLKAQQAFSAADAGAQLTVANWDPMTMNFMSDGDSVSIGGTLTGNVGWYRGYVRRLNDQLFLVRSEGFSMDSTMRQRVGLLVRLRPVEINVKSALETQGALAIGGSSQIDGNDNVPGVWSDCPPAGSPLPGIRMTDSSLITTSGCGSLSCVDGSPKVEEDTTVSDSTLTTFGDMSFSDLESLATKIVSGGNMKIEPSLNADASCNTGDDSNWGDPQNPTAACGNYWPIIWSDGDLNINGVEGQGVLIVNGDLNVQGGFEFYGPVIIKGTLSTQGTGGHFNGGVVAANINLEQNTVLGNAVVNFSSCALSKAMQNSSQASLIRDRSWVDLY